MAPPSDWQNHAPFGVIVGMSDCENIIPETGKVCGADPGGPFHSRFCSDECADRVNQSELAELGITREMMEEALAGYYECKEMIEAKDDSTASVTPEPRSPDSCDQGE